ncbi:MAG: hypothetical protein P4L44_05320 [Oryzomonas sp.]|uniref:hypothetical protein n=1 Tax=Oryzomonas sp. TaxID=2855186 RepID=UPI00283CADB4|nr:hypothetical protein [Oryzomonas sp.]MDR3579361.1 hypothetical protein [Oryzomonas sp.]
MKQFVFAIVLVLSVVSVSHAADYNEAEKDWCLLGIGNKCEGTTTIDLFDKIKRIEIALKKGSSVYTPEELKHLQSMLEETKYAKELLMERN